MSGDPETGKPMDAARKDAETRNEDAPQAPDPRAARDPRDLREASERRSTPSTPMRLWPSISADALRSLRERYRAAYNDELTRWQALTDEPDWLERRATDTGHGSSALRMTSRGQRRPTRRGSNGRHPTQARTGAEDDRIRALRSDVTNLGHELGSHQTELAKLEVALRNL